MAASSPTRTRTRTIAIVGNPNAGKTSLFNALTGSHQKVGNYPGVTVEKVSGWLDLEGERVECFDVPGLYSVRPISVDEKVAMEAITNLEGSPPDLLVYVLDASNLERNLFLYSQVAELGLPLVVALTMGDVLASRGQILNVAALSVALGVPVVPVVSHKGRGLPELRQAMRRSLEAPSISTMELRYPAMLTLAVENLEERLARSGFDVRRVAIREAILDPAADLAVRLEAVPELHMALEEERSKVLGAGIQGRTLDAQTRYAWAASVRRGAISGSPGKRSSVSDRIDRILTHRVFGLLVFVGMMYALFQSIYTLAAPLMTLIEKGVAAVSNLVEPLFAGAPTLQSLVVDGVLAGVGAVVVFLPQILILFLLISILEGTGYLARASFLMDRLFGWCGLNGRAFIPLLSSFACAVPGIMAARVMPDSRSRLVTVLVAPLMSCSARLPVYVLFIGAFIQPRFGAGWAGFALFAMHFVGLAVAIPVVLILNRGVVKGKRLPFVLELPPYQWPRSRDVTMTVMTRGKVFLKTAGTMIFALSIVIWALTFFPRSEAQTAEYQREYLAQPAQFREHVPQETFVASRQTSNSYLGRFGKTIEPVFEPAGFDWRLSVAILAAFPAREVMVSALGIVFDLGGDVDEASGDLRGALEQATWPDGRPLLTIWTAIGLMVFFALCCQCMATLAAIRRETNSYRWPIFAFSYMTALAYLGAVAVHQLGKLFGAT